MTRTMSVALGVGGLALVWVVASGSPPLPQRDRPAVVPPAAAAPPLDFDREAARLHERLLHPASYPPPVRNPFTFGTVTTAPTRTRTAPAPPVSVEPANNTDAPRPADPNRPRLLAILSDAAGDPIRRAVVGIGDDVVIVRVGDAVSHFHVRSISTDAVELIDAATAVVTRITLR